MTDFVSNYFANAVTIRETSAAGYGVDRGRTEQITTPGVYADSLLGRCSACEPAVESRQYVDIMRQYQEVRQAENANAVTAAEVQRRNKLLDAGKLDPFEPTREQA